MGLPSMQMPQDKRLLLDRLEEISLHNFPTSNKDDHNEIVDTPTSGTTCLPTPPRADTLRLPSRPVRVTEARPLGLCYHPGVQDEQLPCPPAPMLKDLDSFTDDTGKGSFDSIPAAEFDEQARPLPQITASVLAALPPHDTCLSIESWREDVSSSTPQPGELISTCAEAYFDVDTPVVEMSAPENIDADAATSSPLVHPTKRPRSYTSSSSDDSVIGSSTNAGKRTCVSATRARVKSLSATSSVFVNPLIWTESIDLPIPARPPSRARAVPAG